MADERKGMCEALLARDHIKLRADLSSEPLSLRSKRVIIDWWRKEKPTIEECRLIILMIIGATTQFLAKVQGMSKEVALRLEKRARKFLWAEKEKSE
jgi:hypothetical protein